VSLSGRQESSWIEVAENKFRRILLKLKLAFGFHISMKFRDWLLKEERAIKPLIKTNMVATKWRRYFLKMLVLVGARINIFRHKYNEEEGRR
jgi:hypothetical protein